MDTKQVNIPEGLKIDRLTSNRAIIETSVNPEQYNRWFLQNELLGVVVGRKTNVLGLDVDEGGVETLQANGWTLPESLGCNSPTEGNFHLVLQMPSGTFPIASKNNVFGKGLSIKASDDNYIIISGKGYKTFGNEIAYPPDWMIDLLVDASVSKKPYDPNKVYSEEEENEFAEWLMGIIDRHRASTYDEWLQVGMSLSTMQDQRFAFKLFHDFSRRGEGYIDEWDCQKKFDTFTRESGENRCTLGTLYHLAVEEDNPQLLVHSPIGKKEAKDLDQEIRRVKEETKENDLPNLDDELTPLGNSKRLIALHGHEIKWCEEEKVWYVWNGKKWEADTSNKVLSFCEDVVKNLLKEAVESQDLDERRRLTRHALASQTGNSFKDMLFLSRGHGVRIEEFDNDATLLNCNNGIVNLVTGELLPHSSKYMMRRIAPFDFDPKADCPKWKDFLTFSQNNDADVIHYMQKTLGLSASGQTDKFLGWMYGVPNTGKSTLSETLLTILGDYAEKTNIVAFSKNIFDEGGDKPNSYVTGLKGKRFVVANETRKDGRLDVALLKDLSGMDTLTGRKQHGTKETFMATHTLWIYGNHQPNLRDDADDDAFFYRLGEIPFMRELPKQENGSFRPLEEVKAEYLAEASGILNWLVQGYQMWRKEGLIKPEKVEKATREFQQSQDLLANFIEEEEYVRDAESKIRKSDFKDDYDAWLKKIGEKAVGVSTLSRRMTSLGFPVGGNGKAFFMGISKKSTAIGSKRLGSINSQDDL